MQQHQIGNCLDFTTQPTVDIKLWEAELRNLFVCMLKLVCIEHTNKPSDINCDFTTKLAPECLYSIGSKFGMMFNGQFCSFIIRLSIGLLLLFLW